MTFTSLNPLRYYFFQSANDAGILLAVPHEVEPVVNFGWGIKRIQIFNDNLLCGRHAVKTNLSSKS